MSKYYAKGIAWIAKNDEPTWMGAEAIAEQISVLLLAEISGKSVQKVAEDVIQARIEEHLV